MNMTQSEIVILGLLKIKDLYGYEIEKYLDNNSMREWTKLGFSSIYNILNKLHKKDLIDFRYEEEQDGPKRKVFYLLDEGKRVFSDNLIERLKEPTTPKPDIDVGIFYSTYLEPEPVIEALKEHREILVDRIESYKKLFERKFANKRTVDMLFKRAIMHMETDIKWIDEIIDDIK